MHLLITHHVNIWNQDNEKKTFEHFRILEFGNSPTDWLS
jgi:hypothetical protein